MARLTRSDIEAVTGPLDDGLIVEIIAAEPTREELVEAFEWLYADDTLANDLHREPSGRVAILCEILSRTEIEQDEDRAEV